MKKFLFLILLSVSTIAVNAQDVANLRNMMTKGADSESIAISLVDQSKKALDNTKKPIYEAFYAMGNFLLAKHSSNPMKQFSYFKKGKNALDNAAKRDPKNLEIRFLRFMTQERAPGFLGYNKNLQADKTFILSEYKNSNDKDLVRRIKNHFKI